MKCPICRSHSLTKVSLDTGLLAQQCNQCFGHWISSENYWEWLDHREHQIKERQGQSKGQPKGQANQQPPILINGLGNLLPVADNTTANFCLDCDRLMTKAKVGRGLSFYLDRCSHCHGVWL
ncbi:MAG: zf-TFIIB domain-containing protein, partial [Phormidesmis sp.]